MGQDNGGQWGDVGRGGAGGPWGRAVLGAKSLGGVQGGDPEEGIQERGHGGDLEEGSLGLGTRGEAQGKGPGAIWLRCSSEPALAEAQAEPSQSPQRAPAAAAPRS